MDLKSFLNLLLKNTPFEVTGKGDVNISVSAGIGIKETAKWQPHWKIEKYHGSACPKNLYAIEEWDGNCLLNEGITAMLNLLVGAAETPFNAANTYIGVGDSTTAAIASQTGLQAATNKVYVAMDGTYPQVLNQTVTFRATFGASVGNYAWNEFTIVSSSDDTGDNLCRKQEAHGTKSSPDTWVVSCTVTIS